MSSKGRPVGQTDPFDSIIAVVHFVAGFKYDAEPTTAKALHGLKVGQVPGEDIWVSKEDTHSSLEEREDLCACCTITKSEGLNKCGHTVAAYQLLKEFPLFPYLPRALSCQLTTQRLPTTPLP